MFQARWRWNLNRSLMVLRFRNGRRNPPPIQRMESDDLLAAVFPQAAACQDNIVGPDRDSGPRAGAPDHRRHAARSARHRRRARACSSASKPARSASTAATRPNRRCWRTRSSPRGRTRSWTTRRRRIGAPTRSTCGAVWSADRAGHDRRAEPGRHRAGARRDRARCWRRPTICTTCCPRRCCSARAPTGRGCGSSWSTAGAARSLVNAGVELWTTTEALAGAPGRAGGRARGGGPRAARSSGAVRA